MTTEKGNRHCQHKFCEGALYCTSEQITFPVEDFFSKCKKIHIYE